MRLLYSYRDGSFSDCDIAPLSNTGGKLVDLTSIKTISAPHGTEYCFLPDLTIIAKDKNGRIIRLSDIQKEKIFPFACVLPAGYIRTAYPAYEKNNKLNILPFFCYYAAGLEKEVIKVAGIKVDGDFRWDPSQFNGRDLKDRIKKKLKKFPNNRIYNHLSNCALNMNCYTAQNIFYERWEGALPTSPVCNAKCLGCISLQKNNESPQNRIRFIPSLSEIVEVATEHLKNPDTMISFGQGCEGEPTLNYELLVNAIIKIREAAPSAKIHLNTNGLNPDAVSKIANAGLGSVRVGVNSVIDESLSRYFKFNGGCVNKVTQTIRTAKNKDLVTHLSILTLNGITDTEKEISALIDFINTNFVDHLLLRNMNIDPDYYYDTIEKPSSHIGIYKWLETLKNNIKAKIGCFNKY